MEDPVGRRLSLPVEVTDSSLCSSPSTITTCSAMSSGYSIATYDKLSSGQMMSFSFPALWYDNDDDDDDDDELNSTRWHDSIPSRSSTSQSTETAIDDSLFHTTESLKNDIPRMPSRSIESSTGLLNSPDSVSKDSIPKMPRRSNSSAKEEQCFVIQGMENIHARLEDLPLRDESSVTGSQKSTGNLPSLVSIPRSSACNTSLRRHSLSAIGSHSSSPELGKLRSLKKASKASKSSPSQFATRKKLYANADSNERYVPVASVDLPTDVSSLASPPPSEEKRSLVRTSARSLDSTLQNRGREPVMKLIPLKLAESSPKSYIKSRRHPSLDRRMRRNSVCSSLTSILEGEDEYASPLIDRKKKRMLKVLPSVDQSLR